MHAAVWEPRQLVDKPAKVTNRAFSSMFLDVFHQVKHDAGQRLVPQLLDCTVAFSPCSDKRTLQALFYLRYTAQEMCGSVKPTPAFEYAELRRA